jgi:hypothetical protein
MNDSVQGDLPSTGPPADGMPGGLGRLPAWAAWAAAGLVVVYTARTLATYLPAHANLNHVSGTWTALAMDLASGTFYRPLWSPDGYGGTRYFPLCFTLHAALIRLGIGPLNAGHLLTIVSALALLAGAYRLMRTLGAGVRLSLPCSVLILAPVASQVALTRIGGDVLPAALNVWGFVCCGGAMDAARGRRKVAAAAVLFTLAFAAKVTSLYGAAAAILAFYLAGRRRAALGLFAFTSLGVALVLACTYVASGGRFLEIMAACASGGTTLHYGIRGPVRLLHTMDKDGIDTILLVTSLGGLALAWRRSWRELSGLALLASVLALCAIFGSPGTASNHFIDFTALSLVFLAVQTGRRRVTPLLLTIVSASVIVAMAFGLATRPPVSRAERYGVDQAVRVVERLGSDPRHPVLSLDPLLPVMAGQRPYLLDLFMYEIIAERFPGARRQMLLQLRDHYFSAVIMERPRGGAGTSATGPRKGELFRGIVEQFYPEAEGRGRYVVHEPKPE